MNLLQIIDRLCAVIREQAKLLYELVAFIHEQTTVDEEIKRGFSERMETINNEVITANIDIGIASEIMKGDVTDGEQWAC